MPKTAPRLDLAGCLVTLSGKTKCGSNRMTVHVIDHDAAVRDALSVTLQASHFEVRTYRSAGDFLAALPITQQGCVLIELDLTDMNTVDLIKTIGDSEMNLPIILMTARLRKPELSSPEPIRIDGILQKPFGRDELLACLEYSLRKP